MRFKEKERNCPYNPNFSIKFLILTKSFRFFPSNLGRAKWAWGSPTTRTRLSFLRLVLLAAVNKTASFFQLKKKRSKKSHRDTCDCVPDPATLLRINIYVILSEALAKSKDLAEGAIIIFLRFAGFPGLRSEWRIRISISQLARRRISLRR